MTMTRTPLLPVSRKFLARIRSRVSDVLASIGKTDTSFLDHVMAIIHAYFEGRLPDLPAATDDSYCCHLIFLTLRAEIDAAILRSRRARESARRRAGLRRQSAAPPPPPQAPAVAPDDPSKIDEELSEEEREKLRRREAFFEKRRKYEEAQIVETLPDGDTRITCPDGKVILKMTDGTVRTTHPDGRVIVQFPGRNFKYHEKWLGDHPYYEAVEEPPIVMKGAPDRNSLAEQIRRAYGLR